MIQTETTKSIPRRMPRSFTGLNRLRPLYVIEDESGYEQARSIADALVGREDLTDGQRKYLETLLLIMETYEDKHYALEQTMSPLEALMFLLDENGMSASDLGRLLGNRPLGAAILRGERGLSKAHILTLAERFKVSPSLFLEKPSRVSPTNRR